MQMRLRSFSYVFVASVALAGCKRQAETLVAPKQSSIVPDAAPAPVMDPIVPKAWFQGAPPQSPGLRLAYTHAVGLEIGGGALAAHFSAARDRCLSTPALHCLLLQADLETPGPAFDGTVGRPSPPRMQSASLRVRLPHDQIVGFANALTDPLPGEKPGLARVVRQSTTAENLTQPISDVAQRVAQQQDYLNSLKSLGSRLTISVSDLVKIASETAQAQTQIEQAQAEQRNLALQVDTEELDVTFEQPQEAVATPDPIDQVKVEARDILDANVADALRFAIAAVPWIPVGLVGLLVLFIARRALFGRRQPAIVRSISAS